MTNTALTTISGVISDGGLAYGLVETGNGSNAPAPLALNNTETYTGPTTVTNAATLQVNGSLNCGERRHGGHECDARGHWHHQRHGHRQCWRHARSRERPPIGTLTINNNLTLNGNLLFKVNKSLSPSQSNDIASVSGTLANGGTGTLTVTNLGPALVVGDRFMLFNKGLSGGGALTVTGGGAGVIWNNNLVYGRQHLGGFRPPAAEAGDYLHDSQRREPDIQRHQWYRQCGRHVLRSVFDQRGRAVIGLDVRIHQHLRHGRHVLGYERHCAGCAQQFLYFETAVVSRFAGQSRRWRKPSTGGSLLMLPV